MEEMNTNIIENEANAHLVLKEVWTNVPDAKTLRSLNIDVTGVDTTLYVYDESENTIKLHLYGMADEKKPLKFDPPKRNAGSVTIKYKTRNNNNGRKLDIFIPITLLLESINVYGVDLNFKIEAGVSSRTIWIENDGKVTCKGNFVECVAFANGKLKIVVEAKSNIIIRARSYNGEVSIKLKNVAMLQDNLVAENGHKEKNFSESAMGYFARVDARSKSGNVKLESFS